MPVHQHTLPTLHLPRGIGSRTLWLFTNLYTRSLHRLPWRLNGSEGLGRLSRNGAVDRVVVPLVVIISKVVAPLLVADAGMSVGAWRVLAVQEHVVVVWVKASKASFWMRWQRWADVSCASGFYHGECWGSTHEALLFCLTLVVTSLHALLIMRQLACLVRWSGWWERWTHELRAARSS